MICMKNFFQEKKVLVAGGLGFLGSNLSLKLASLGAIVTATTRNLSKNKRLSETELKKINIKEVDLLNFEQCLNACKGQDIVINCAFSGSKPSQEKGDATIFRENLLIELNLLEAARLSKVKKYLLVSSAFVYPSNLKKPIKENQVFLGDVHYSKFGYGWSKRACEAAARVYSKQYELNIVIIRPSNIYGPRDNFFSERSTAIASFIEKSFTNKPIVISGNGKAKRSFIYVEDCVEGILLALEKYNSIDPLNISSKEQTTIKDLAEKIVSLSRTKTKIVFDKKLSQGPLFLVPDNTKAKKLIGFEAKTGLEEGLKKTIEWFKEKYDL